MTIKSQTLLLLSALLLIFTACNQGSSTDNVPEAANEQLAWAVANVLADDEVREDVHAAMDASPWTEHKLVLGEFLKSDEGQAFRKELSIQLGGDNKMHQLLADLPEMDFYLPYETHREVWEHAKEQLMVVCVLNVNATEATAYTSDGETKLLDTPEKIRDAMEWALFSLHPEEMKFRRSDLSFQEKKNGDVMADCHEAGIYIESFTNEDVSGHDGFFGGGHEYYFHASTSNYGAYRTEVQHIVYASEFFHSDQYDNSAQISKAIQIYRLPVNYIADNDDEVTIRVYEVDGNNGSYYWDSQSIPNASNPDFPGHKIGKGTTSTDGTVNVGPLEITIQSVDF